MNIPFNTSAEMKTAMSGLDLTLDLDNIRSSLSRVPNDLIELIGLPVYNAMMAHYMEPNVENATVWDDFVKLCQKAMLPMALYKHFIWLQLRVSNNGITTAKNDRETTAYKYQTDEAKESLLDSWGDFVSQLIDFLNANQDVITEWPQTEQYKNQVNIVFTGYRQFCKVANIRPADAAFYIRICDMLQDITIDEVEPMLNVNDLAATDKKLRKIQKFVAYRALSLSAIQFDVSALPSPVRKTMANEMSAKSGQEYDYVKVKLSGHYKQEAESWLQKLSNDITAEEKSKDTTDTNTITSTVYKSTDKAIGIC